MSYVLSPSASKVEVMTFNKTGTADLVNLPYTIVSNSLVDLGSANWTELTSASDHPSMEITPTYGVKFKKTGYYRVDSGLFLYGADPVSGTTNIISQNRVSTTPPETAQPGHYPVAGAVPDIAYNRFDLALGNGGVLGLDPDLNCVIKVETVDTTVWFYVNISGTPDNECVVRGDTNPINKLSTMSITRMGDLL